MSELREAIRDKVKGIAVDATVHDMPYSERFARYEMYTDDLIALITAAILSEQAVNVLLAVQFGEDEFAMQREDERDEYREDARCELSALLAAIGLTTGGQGT